MHRFQSRALTTAWHLQTASMRAAGKLTLQTESHTSNGLHATSAKEMPLLVPFMTVSTLDSHLLPLTSACASSSARQVSALRLGSPGACISMRSILPSKYCTDVWIACMFDTSYINSQVDYLPWSPSRFGRLHSVAHFEHHPCKTCKSDRLQNRPPNRHSPTTQCLGRSCGIARPEKGMQAGSSIC